MVEVNTNEALNGLLLRTEQKSRAFSNDSRYSKL